MKVTSIDRETCRLLRPNIDAALKAVADQFGLAYKPGSARFSPGNVTFKAEFAVVGDGGTVMGKEAEDFKFYAYRYGLKAEDLGRSFQWAGRTYKITGAKPKSFRFPILCETGGRTYKMPADTVRNGLNAAPVANPATASLSPEILAALKQAGVEVPQ